MVIYQFQCHEWLDVCCSGGHLLWENRSGHDVLVEFLNHQTVPFLQIAFKGKTTKHQVTTKQKVHNCRQASTTDDIYRDKHRYPIRQEINLKSI